MNEFLLANRFTFLMIVVFSVVFVIYYITIVKRGGDKKVKQAIRSLVNEKIKDGDSYSAASLSPPGRNSPGPCGGKRIHLFLSHLFCLTKPWNLYKGRGSIQPW